MMRWTILAVVVACDGPGNIKVGDDTDGSGPLADPVCAAVAGWLDEYRADLVEDWGPGADGARVVSCGEALTRDGEGTIEAVAGYTTHTERDTTIDWTVDLRCDVAQYDQGWVADRCASDDPVRGEYEDTAANL